MSILTRYKKNLFQGWVFLQQFYKNSVLSLSFLPIYTCWYAHKWIVFTFSDIVEFLFYPAHPPPPLPVASDLSKPLLLIVHSFFLKLDFCFFSNFFFKIRLYCFEKSIINITEFGCIVTLTQVYCEQCQWNLTQREKDEKLYTISLRILIPLNKTAS